MKRPINILPARTECDRSPLTGLYRKHICSFSSSPPAQLSTPSQNWSGLMQVWPEVFDLEEPLRYLLINLLPPIRVGLAEGQK